MTRLLSRLRRWYCNVAHRDLWIYLPWGVICQRCGRVVREEKGEKG